MGSYAKPADSLRKPPEGLQNQSHGFDAQLIVAVQAGLDLPAAHDLIEFLDHRARLLGGQVQNMIIAGA